MTRLPVVCLAVAVAGSACAVKIDSGGYVEHDEKRFAAETTMNLRLSTFDGAIEVRGWDKPEIVVLIEKRAQDKASVSKIQVNIEQKDDSIQIEAHNPDKRGVFVGFGSFTSQGSPSSGLAVQIPGVGPAMGQPAGGAQTCQVTSGQLAPIGSRPSHLPSGLHTRSKSHCRFALLSQ